MEGAGAAWLPAVIGNYRIVRVIGEGGMGVVYEARQSHPDRTVALKVIKPGFATAELAHRFRQETQALGRLQHPGIAQIYEAGTAETPFGPQPYFAMEFIRGQSLSAYAAENSLSVRQRLELMMRICDAVDHAHQRGLIHRDLKPANILVDESGQPKILDFGVSRLTDSDVHRTRHTDLGELVGTLAYMSPEQVLADPSQLDTRSDVYALGVILYELLAGRLPYVVGPRVHEAVKTIQEDDPKRLSSISRVYRGDLETIAGKALEKDKTRRYGSASELGDEIRRYLQDQPITARPASATYQLRKFARRHKTFVGALVAVMIVLTAGIAVSTWLAIRANRERDRAVREKERADTEAATAKAVNDFLQNDLLAQASTRTQARPDVKPDPDLKVRTALDRAAARIEGKFPGQPAVEASIRHTLGETYFHLGMYAEAQRELERAIDLGSRARGAEHPDSVRSLKTLGELHIVRGNAADAQAVLNRVLDVQRRLYGEADKEALGAMNGLSILYLDQGKYREAEDLARTVLDATIRVDGPESEGAATLASNLGLVYWRQGKHQQAEELFTKSVDVARRVLGEEHPQTMMSMNNLALAYGDQGKFVQEQEIHSRLLAVRQRVLGPEHPEGFFSMRNLAFAYLRGGKYKDADALYEKLQNLEQRVLGERHPQALMTLYLQAFSYRAQSRYEESDNILTRVHGIRRQVLGDRHPETIKSMFGLAINAMLRGRYAEAEPRILHALTLWREILGPEHPDTVAALTALGETRLGRQQYRDSESVLREALQIQEKVKAMPWQRHNVQSLLGATLAGQKRYAEAEPLLVSAYQGLIAVERRIPAYSKIFIPRARERLDSLYVAWGKPAPVLER
jgi:tetratricopeptide (TPR) repeat protein